MTIKIGLVVDWPRSQRKCFWPDVLARIKTKDSFEVTLLPLSDLIVDPDKEDATRDELLALRDQDVLIINWDAINGDPDYGAHLAQMWIRHHSPELLTWVRNGNVLIIESQAVFGVPSQAAYDAATRPSELPVPGLPNPEFPLTFKKLQGDCCQKTKKFPKSHGFEDVDDLIRVKGPVDRDLFPETTTNLLIEETRQLDWSKILYRGWFRRTIPGERSLCWVTLARTKGRGRWREQSTLQVAKLGRGTIFATTMLLAQTGQEELIEAMITCARDNAHIPTPEPNINALRTAFRWVLTLSGGVLIAYSFDLYSVQISKLSSYFFLEGKTVEDTLKTTSKVLLVPVGMLIFEGLWRAALHVHKFGTSIMGWT